MSWYVSDSRISQSDGNKDWWKKIYGPGETVPVSGIYRCLGWNKEITSNGDDPFPPQNHHQHSTAQGTIHWKLNIRTNTTGE